MSELMISSDSHVIEPNDLWSQRLPARFRDKAPKYSARSNFQRHDGGADPNKRIKEMAVDGVSAEVLYGSLGLNQFGMQDAELQEACFRVYNDWLIEYCSHEPDRLFGLGHISAYNIDKAVEEVQRCKNHGMLGITLWQVPPDELSFAGQHYERLWATCQELQMPVSLHILTGMPYPPERFANKDPSMAVRLKSAVNKKLLFTSDSLLDIIASGVFDRFPDLKVVLVETEASWLPFCLGQWDRYIKKSFKNAALKMLPSEYFKRNVYVTFFNDPPLGMMFPKWGMDNCMWSNDFPHGNSTWPNSREVIARDLGHLSGADRAKLVSENVTKLYELPVIEALAAAA